MDITENTLNTVVVLEFSGRLDASAVKDCKVKVKELVDSKNINIVIDLKDVNFIDSSGLGILVASLRTVNKVGGDIKIASIQEQVRSIFELTRLHRIFEIFDESSSAAKSFD